MVIITCYLTQTSTSRAGIYLCVMCIDFAYFWDFEIWIWNCSDSVAFLFLFFTLFQENVKLQAAFTFSNWLLLADITCILTTRLHFYSASSLKQQSAGIDMSLHSDTLSRFRANESLLFHCNTVCLGQKQNIQMYGFWFYPIGVRNHDLPHPRRAR